MQLSFIVTAYNVEAYIERCLNSVLDAARPGDEILIVDDGSTDATVSLIQRVADAQDVSPFVWHPILLGANTHGGVGSAANIALDRAHGDTVFFVDGDDWLEPEGFRAARAQFEAGTDEIMIANYREFDQVGQQAKAPADDPLWADLIGADIRPVPAPDAQDGDDADGVTPLRGRILALAMIAAPWRKFYRRAALERDVIRFPEGDFFFEDNPFHWDVCLKARRIGFCNQIVCHHRVNRPGQTMMALDRRLTAFFDHYDLIVGKLPALDSGDDTAGPLHVAAMDWLLHNMNWHLMRIESAAFWAYADRAGQAVQSFDSALWNQVIKPRFADTRVGTAVAQLRSASTAEVVTLWHAETQTALQQDVMTRMDRIERSFGNLDRISNRLETLRAQAELQALRDIGQQDLS